MSLREEFVLKALAPYANISELCREYGVSRKTGYKWVQRFKDRGIEGLRDLTRRPHNSPLRASGEVVLQVLELRRAHPRWGPRKLRAVLQRSLPDAEVPSERTIARILERAGEVRPRRRRSEGSASSEQPSVSVEASNDLWTVDFKGWWRTRDGRRAEPLTVRDDFSRFVLCAELMETTNGVEVRRVFEGLFDRFGLPAAIKVDNGAPFASTRSPAGLTTLSAWWVSLGIRVVRSRPGHPQDNGGHERMHLDMRFDVEDVPADDIGAQRAALETWRHEFNHVRPHEALALGVPADVYQKSTRLHRGPRKAWYPPGFEMRRVNAKGSVKFAGKTRFVSTALAGQEIALRRLEDGTFEMRFYEVDLGRLELAA